MAKVRRLITSRSEHFLGSFNGVARGHGYGTVTEESEFREEDVWSMVDREDDKNNNNNNDHTKYYSGGGGGAWNSRAEYGGRREADDPSRRARIPRRDNNNRHVGGLSLAFEETPLPRVVHQHRTAHENGDDGVDPISTPRRRHHHVTASAPVNVPDWNRILHRVDSSESIHDSDELTGFDENESEGGWFPPHEYLARSRKSAATSVFEGVGRTLKGRDLSRLRDAVWNQTGFDG